MAISEERYLREREFSRQVRAGYIAWMRAEKLDIELSMNFRDGVGRELAVRAARIFWQSIDCEIYGKKAVRKNNTRLKRACVLEGAVKNCNLHYHCAVQLPALMSGVESDEERSARMHEFCAFLISRWEEFWQAGRYSTCEPIDTVEGFTVYICKDVRRAEGSYCLETSTLNT